MDAADRQATTRRDIADWQAATGTRLRAARERAGLSLRGAGAAAGISFNGVRKAEGGGEITLKTLAALCLAYGIRPQALLPELGSSPHLPGDADADGV